MNYTEMFIEYKKSQKCSPITIREYGICINIYNKWIMENCLDIEKVTRKDIIMYRTHLSTMKSKIGKPLEDNSILKLLAVVNSFYNFLLDIELIKSNPAAGVSIKIKQRLPIFLNEQELKQYSDIAKANKVNHLIFILIVSTGMRASEFLNICKKDIDTVKCEITVIGKGNKERKVYFMPALRTEIISNIADLSPEDRILRDINCYQAIRNRVDRMTKVFNMYRVERGEAPKKITLHKLRHSFATKCYRDGVDILSIQKMLGHKSLNTTKIYTEVEDNQVRDSYKNIKGMADL